MLIVSRRTSNAVYFPPRTWLGGTAGFNVFLSGVQKPLTAAAALRSAYRTYKDICPAGAGSLRQQGRVVQHAPITGTAAFRNPWPPPCGRFVTAKSPPM
eukprot:jgi/Chrzof1/9536/Cz04g07010.t1